MPFETVAVSSWERVDNNLSPKLPEKFADEINEVYERAASLGGQIVSHEMVMLRVEIGDMAKIDPQNHAILVIELPE